MKLTKWGYGKFPEPQKAHIAVVVPFEHERFMLARALCHACRYAKIMEYDKSWSDEMEAMQEVLDQYEEDEED